MSLRNWLDKLRPQFEEGGKWHAFKSIYDGMDTFLYVPNETSKSGTSIHDAIDSKRIMSIVVLSLVPAMLFGMYNIGYQNALAAGKRLMLPAGECSSMVCLRCCQKSLYLTLSA